MKRVFWRLVQLCVVILFVWSLSTSGHAEPRASSIMNFIAWDSVTGNIRPTVNPSGQYVALSNPYLKVWHIEHNFPVEVVFDSHSMNPHLRPTSYAWIQDKLMVSGIKDDNSVETVLFNAQSKSLSILSNKLYQQILTRSDGRYVGCVEKENTRGSRLGVWSLGIDTAHLKISAKPIQIYHRLKNSVLTTSPSLLCWSNDGRGIFLKDTLTYFDRDDNSQVQKESLVYLPIEGEPTEVLPATAWLNTSTDPCPIGNDDLFAAVDYFGSTPALIKINPRKIESNLLWRSIRERVSKAKEVGMPNPRLVSLSPNGQLIIIQNFDPHQSDNDYLTPQRVISLNLNQWKYRELCEVGRLTEMGWSNSGLVVSYFDRRDEEQYLTGLLLCSEASMNKSSEQFTLAMGNQYKIVPDIPKPRS